MMQRTLSIAITLQLLCLGLVVPAVGRWPVAASLAQTIAPPTQPAVKILAPVLDTVLDLPAATVVVKYPSNSTVELTVNGTPVDPSLIGRTETDAESGSITQMWYGVSLQPGENFINVQTSAGQSDSVRVLVRGVPTAIQLSTPENRVPADGRSLLTINGRLIDENGQPSKHDTIATLYTTAGEFAGVDANRDQPGFQVPIQGGQFQAQLRPGLEAQNVNIRATAMGLESSTQVQFTTNLRAGITTGLINLQFGPRGTDYYRPYAEYLPIDGDHASTLRIQGQGFTTGRLGDWSATGAYNSDRPLNRTCHGGDRLFRDLGSPQNCEDLYPVTGDSSKVDVLAPSRSSVYVKLESSVGVTGNTPNRLMWGDYTTSELATRSQQFSATNRNLHGAKVNYNFGSLLLSGFYGDNVQGFQRDTIAPDGTTGYYFLSQRLLIGGSEQLSIETEALERPGTVVQVATLNRGSDYEIDYDRGSILLRQPLLRTTTTPTGEILVRRLVATYQYAGGGQSNIFGGRAQYSLSNNPSRESWLGTSWVQENRGLQNFGLWGADALLSLSPTSSLTAEYARSHNGTGLSNVTGNAFRLEGNFKFSDATTARTHYQSTEAGFANNATTSFVPGQTRYGAELATRLGADTNLRLQADREENRGTPPLAVFNPLALINPTNPLQGQVDNDLTTWSAGLQQRFGLWGNNSTADLDYVQRQRQDRLATTPALADVSSSQIRSRLAMPLAPNLTLRAQNEVNLSNQQDVLYPNRTALGLEWAVHPGINLRLSQNFIDSKQFGQVNYTSLDLDSTYALTPTTRVVGRYSLNPYQSIGSLGIQQGIILRPGLKLDLNYERVIGGLPVSATGQQFPQPYAIGQTAASLGVSGGDSYGIALNYTDNPNFQANARYEYRNTATSNGSNLSAGITGKLAPEVTALVRYQQNGAANQLLRDGGLGDTVNLKLGLAFRNPQSDQWNALLSYQYRSNPSLLPASILLASGSGSSDHTLALEAVYAPNWQWEFAGRYALRNATSYLDSTFSASNTIGISQLRATYRLGYNWDLTGDVRWLSQYANGRNELGAALEAGYYLTPNLRLATGYGLGVSDDPNSRRSASGPYVGLTLKLNDLFGGFGRQEITPPQQQESQSR